jgi:SAM-dependent methyltransferase
MSGGSQSGIVADPLGQRVGVESAQCYSRGVGQFAVSTALAVIRLCRFTPFRGTGAGFGSASAEPFANARFEAAGVGEFYRLFPQLPAALADKDVLDFGCGYGGKTVEYARHARSVCGIEPHPVHIAQARAYAAAQDSAAEFRLCAQDRVPCPDSSFDAVLCHDVLEHVADPAVSLAEIARVLRPGGTAYIAFPPYDGALSHHLDYACRLPGLHWLFGARTLALTVNTMIDRGELAMARQPVGDTLPQLNGLTTARFTELARMFPQADIRRRIIGSHRGGAIGTAHRIMRALAWAHPPLRERFAAGVVAVLVKHQTCTRLVPSEMKRAA